MDDGQVEVDPRRLQIVSAVLVLSAIAVAVWLVPPLFADDAPPVAASARPSELLTTGPPPSPEEGASSVSAAPATEVTATAEPTVTVEPSVTPEPTATATEDGPPATVLFGGGPAQGPWQQLGTVAEITHPGAPQSARYSYEMIWADPGEENRPDELWDRLVIEVTEQLIELGDPVDRPAFGSAPGTEPFNSSGGIQDIYTEDGVYTAYWSGLFEDAEGVGRAYYYYLISFENEVIDSDGPFIVREDGQRTFRDNSAAFLATVRAWAAAHGHTR